MGRCRSTPAKELQHMTGQFDAQKCRPEYVGGNNGEFMDFEAASKQAARLKSFGNVPLLIISQDPELRKRGMTANDIAEMPVWAREQEALKQLSQQSWRVIARNSGHAIYRDRPSVVVAEMTRLIGYLRGGPAPPFGSTTTN